MIVKIILAILAAFVVHHCIKLGFAFGFHKNVFNHYPGSCRQIEGIGPGSENFHMLANGTTFITSGFRFPHNPPGYEQYYKETKAKGRIHLFDLSAPDTPIRELTMTSTKDFDKDRFQPHGISGWEDKTTGKLFLFVVNHEKDGIETVEKFLVSVEETTLQHIKSYHDPNFRLINDVLATGNDSFYVTNFLYYGNKLGQMAELLLMARWGYFGYFDGNSYNTVADGLVTPNGIAMSNDGRYIYVAMFAGQDLAIYERQNKKKLTLIEMFPLDSNPDNVVVDPVSGDLYIGLHPIRHLTNSHVDDPREPAPSQVLQVKLKNGRVSSVTELFVDDGHLISASSVATVYGKNMLIGSIINKLVLCEVTVPL